MRRTQSVTTGAPSAGMAANTSGAFNDAPENKNPQIQIHQFIEAQRYSYTKNPRKIKQFRNYVQGEQKIVLTPKQKKMLGEIFGQDFCDNVCQQIIFEARGRLRFTGWDCQNEAVKKQLDDWFITTNLISAQVDAHQSMLTDGNHVLAVNWDPESQSVQVYQEPWWDGVEGIFIGYNAIGRPSYAVKDWTEEVNGQPVWRRIIWYPDRLERYISQVNSPESWQKFTFEDDPVNEDGSIPWLDRNGQALGLPFVHLQDGFKMKGNYGISELDGGIIGLQDQINGCQWDLTAGSQNTAYQMYYGTGVRFKDEKGKDISPDMGAGNWVSSPKAESRFGVLPAGDLSQILNALREKRTTAAVLTATPVFRVIGKEWPSGEAIVQSEQTSVSKAKDQQAKLTAAYSTLGYKMVRIYNRFRPSSKPELPADIANSAILAKFEDPERRDALSKSVIANNLGDNVPIQEIWRLMGYDEDKVAKLYKEYKQNVKDGIRTDKKAKEQPGANAFGSQPKPKSDNLNQRSIPKNGGN